MEIAKPTILPPCGAHRMLQSRSRYLALQYSRVCRDVFGCVHRHVTSRCVNIRAASRHAARMRSRGSRDRAGVTGRGRRTSDQCDQCSLARRVTRAAYEYLRL